MFCKETYKSASEFAANWSTLLSLSCFYFYFWLEYYVNEQTVCNLMKVNCEL
jgi:hypothetical protein